ncbi:MAG: hypothetical protein COW01_15795 [Bdellovibrionales bacterium CG12_big_fil_rev_8_21_14_0_65_38_15]|nr:MAG: hypothetical protein COW79_14960 [Bdellovibrionales bacterium CG22_combo_CG10-13_8_21_14_all_38_13]PIQ52432.1 MAG: hypothetical protein COW01_15795 [Bdellovibrionales bacterium CG12_big_fil_rev_8_21_14_0_65_38_15]
MEQGLRHAHQLSSLEDNCPTLVVLAFHYFSLPIHNEQLLRKLYLEMDFSSYQIAEISGWSKTSVADALRNLGIFKEERKGPLPRYGKRLEGGKLIPHLGEQKVINKMLSLRNKGLSYEAIASELNKKKIPSKNGGQWHKSTIIEILKRKLNKEA